MPNTKQATRRLLSTRNIVEMVLPFLLGILAAGMRLSSYRRIFLRTISSSPSTQHLALDRAPNGLVSVADNSRLRD